MLWNQKNHQHPRGLHLRWGPFRHRNCNQNIEMFVDTGMQIMGAQTIVSRNYQLWIHFVFTLVIWLKELCISEPGTRVSVTTMQFIVYLHSNQGKFNTSLTPYFNPSLYNSSLFCCTDWVQKILPPNLPASLLLQHTPNPEAKKIHERRMYQPVIKMPESIEVS